MPVARIIVLCTGNSCRSQMAEGFLKSFDPEMEVYSAGTHPAPHVHPKAVDVMREVGVEIGGGQPKKVDEFLGQPFDWVITVCGDADENCPAFIGKVANRAHIGFEDPARATGTEEEIDGVFRRVREEIRDCFREFYETEILNNGGE